MNFATPPAILWVFGTTAFSSKSRFLKRFLYSRESLKLLCYAGRAHRVECGLDNSLWTQLLRLQALTIEYLNFNRVFLTIYGYFIVLRFTPRLEHWFFVPWLIRGQTKGTSNRGDHLP